MKAKPFDAISFDAFGTLVVIGDPRHAYAKLFKKLGLQKAGLGRRVMTTNADIQAVLTELNICHIPADVLSKFQDDLQAEIASIQLYPGVADTLTHLRTSGYKLWVASNLAPPYGPPLIAALTDYVDGFSLSYLCGSVKPESTIFMQVYKGLQIPSNRILMVGDNPISDIEGAQRFGMQAELVPAEGISMCWIQRVLETEEVEDMTGSLARYAKDIPEKPFSEVREQVWAEVAKLVDENVLPGSSFKGLEEKYHHLFETDGNGKILRGIEVDSGWRRVVEKLLERLEWIRTHNTHILNPDYDPTRKHEDEYLVTPCIPGPDHVIKIFQIKQKFSDLRCYVTVTEDPQGIAKEQVGEAIAYAAGQARLTCEKCGRVGNRDGTAPEPTKGGWQVIMCDACKEKWMMERAEKAASK